MRFTSPHPGGFDEELDEIIHKFGSEFRLNYSDFIYVVFRHGRHLESENKGNRNYQTFGYGIGVYGFMLDFMKIKAEPNLPLDNIWAINLGLTINLEKGF